jgi:hypothetical protein
MRRLLTPLILIVLVLTGCKPAVSGTPAPEPRKIDCDLIFPGPDHR